MAMPLEGIRVLDWTMFQQGPVASSMLGDMGAEVIKIEPLGTGDLARGYATFAGIDLRLPGGRTSYFDVNNRNKKSIAIDLRKTAGREIVYRLVERSDVFLQNFRVGVAQRLGVDYEALRQQNPKLVYASASGFGSLGPHSERPVYDTIGQARSGFLDTLASLEVEEPCHLQYGMADQVGAITLAYGVAIALLARERLGVGQHVESSLLGSMLWLQSLYVHTYLLKGKTFPRIARHEAPNPLVTYYRCKDGKWLFLALIQVSRFWSDFCRALGRPELEHDERFTRVADPTASHRELIEELDRIFATRTAPEWFETFSAFPDFVFETANSFDDLLADPQVQANNYVIDCPHPTLGAIKMLNVPVTLSASPGGVSLPAPEYGQHTDEVLTEIGGFTWDDIAAFRQAEAI